MAEWQRAFLVALVEWSCSGGIAPEGSKVLLWQAQDSIGENREMIGQHYERDALLIYSAMTRVNKKKKMLQHASSLSAACLGDR